MLWSLLDVRHRRLARRGALVSAVVGLAVALPAHAQQQHDVVVADDAFQPATIEIEVGDTVVWTQEGSNPHSVTSDAGQGESFDSHPACPGSCMGQGDTFEHTFTNPGEFLYHCKVHGGEGGVGMSGTVVVQAAQEDPTPTPPPAAPTPVAAPAQDTASPLPETGSGWGMSMFVVGIAAGVLVLSRRLVARRGSSR